MANRMTITTVCITTPWVKTFDSFLDVYHWLKSMDLEDGWRHVSNGRWFRYVDEGGEEPLKTHVLEYAEC